VSAGTGTIGGWCAIPSVFSAELMGRCGFDWVCIDTQHGLIGYDQLTGMIQGLSITGTPVVVRVPWNQPDHIMKALDAGAQGVIVPMVNSGEDARRAVEAVRYPPEGSRSWGPIRASLDVPGYAPELANARTILVPMIETREGVENMDDILSTPGVDAAYIGPSDLALAHGMTPTLNATEPAHLELIESILHACQRHGVIPGIHTDGIDNTLRWREMGFRMMTLASDAVLMRQAASAGVHTFKDTAAASSSTGSYA
jgi:4-hydroxy-2-oxoheptanedioate aldolase